MKNKSLLSLLLIFTVLITVKAQEGLNTLDKVIELSKVKSASNDSIKNWKASGVFNFSANQSAFTNWLAGGNNNISAISGINYNINYKKEDWIWDNKFILAYGVSKNEGQNLIKTDDRIEINSIVGKKASKNWSYSYFMNFRTQFTDGFNIALDPNENFRTSTFLAPGYFTTGPGMVWKKSEDLFVNLSPATSKITIVSKEVFNYLNSVPTSSKVTEAFGVKANETLRFELGFYANAFYQFNLMENIKMRNSLALYSNYLEDPQNVDIDYTALITMKVNKWLSSTFTYQMVYDDNAFRGFQTRQILGFGLNYNF